MGQGAQRRKLTAIGASTALRAPRVHTMTPRQPHQRPCATGWRAARTDGMCALPAAAPVVRHPEIPVGPVRVLAAKRTQSVIRPLRQASCTPLRTWRVLHGRCVDVPGPEGQGPLGSSVRVLRGVCTLAGATRGRGPVRARVRHWQPLTVNWQLSVPILPILSIVLTAVCAVRVVMRPTEW
jgi:hypothetical protein